jgi:hypothetical protein
LFAMVFKLFSCVFVSILEAYFKCFICLQTYVASVASGYFKNISGAAYVAMRVRSRGDASGTHTVWQHRSRMCT